LQFEELKKLINKAKNGEDFDFLVDELRIIAANIKNSETLQVIESALTKSRVLELNSATIELLELRIKQEFHKSEKIKELSEYTDEMIQLSTKEDCTENLALSYTVKWGVEKLRGNIEISNESLVKAKEFTNRLKNRDYTYYICTYSFAVNDWFEHHDSRNTNKLEDCSDYFLKEEYYRSLAQSLGILCLIYLKNNDHENAVKTSKRILQNRNLMDKLSLDIKSIVYYLTGVGQILQSNLKNAEVFFNESLMIFENIKDSSLYYNYYYSRSIAHIATIQALAGNWDSAYRNMKRIENLLEYDSITKNFDEHSAKQIPHTLNLIKFYIYSRLQIFETSKYEELIDSIYMNLEKKHSNPILLIEYIINANLDEKRLKNLSKSDSENLKRIKHIIDYEILKRKSLLSSQSSGLSKSCIQILENRKRRKGETYLEEAFTDLLIAKELFLDRQYEKIHTSLKKYKYRLSGLEVLEFRIFMEAFIQVGSFKSGDPLGPALQYMAIKKCRQYGFSRLENKLLNYLDIQGRETIRMMT